MTRPLRLSAYFCAYFLYAGAVVPYFSLYLAARGFGAGEIAVVLAMPQLARVIAPALWGWLADRSGAARGIVVFSAAAVLAGFALHLVGLPALAFWRRRLEAAAATAS